MHTVTVAMRTQGRGTQSTTKFHLLKSEMVSVSVCIIYYEQKPIVILSMHVMETLIINPRKRRVMI